VAEDDAVRNALAMSLAAAVIPWRRSARRGISSMPGRAASQGCLVADMDPSDLGVVELLRTFAAAQAALLANITGRCLKRRAPVGGLPPGQILFLDKPVGIDELLRLIRIALTDACRYRPGP
jgi:hypothetical protein